MVVGVINGGGRVSRWAGRCLDGWVRVVSYMGECCGRCCCCCYLVVSACHYYVRTTRGSRERQFGGNFRTGYTACISVLRIEFDLQVKRVIRSLCSGRGTRRSCRLLWVLTCEFIVFYQVLGTAVPGIFKFRRTDSASSISSHTH